MAKSCGTNQSCIAIIIFHINISTFIYQHSCCIGMAFI